MHLSRYKQCHGHCLESLKTLVFGDVSFGSRSSVPNNPNFIRKSWDTGTPLGSFPGLLNLIIHYRSPWRTGETLQCPTPCGHCREGVLFFPLDVQDREGASINLTTPILPSPHPTLPPFSFWRKGLVNTTRNLSSIRTRRTTVCLPCVCPLCAKSCGCPSCLS